MNLDDFTLSLEGVRRAGPDSVMAKCPAHEDHSPSLKVTDAGDRLLLVCYAGCSVDDILAALGLDWGVLFEGEYERAPIQPSLRVEDRRRLVCRHHHAFTVAAMDGPASPELYALREQYGPAEFDQIAAEFADPSWLKADRWQREYRRWSK